MKRQIRCSGVSLLILAAAFLPGIGVYGQEGKGRVGFTATRNPAHGAVKTVGGMEFVFIKGGEFMMGSPDGKGSTNQHPQHRVKVSGFWMGKYEVTQQQYRAISGTNPSHFKGDNLPVENVNWIDAKNFCEKFSRKYSVQARLPFEAEWEYACRAGTTTVYYWGDGIDGNYFWNSDNSGETPHAPGGKRPNAWGLYDMIGNVEEWCEDWYGEDYYRSSPCENPTGPDTGERRFRVVRGGSWSHHADYLSSSFREWFSMVSFYSFLGFRVMLAP